MTRKLPEPQAGSKTRMEAMRLAQVLQLANILARLLQLLRRSSRKSGFSTLRMFGTLV